MRADRGHEIDRWVAGLRGPAPPVPPPDVRGIERRRQRARIGAAALALAAAAALVWVWPPDGATLRGIGGGAGGDAIELQLVMSDGSVASRLDRSRTYRIGQLAYFRVSVDAPTPVALWVEGPAGTEDIARRTVGPGSAPLQTDGGYLVYEFERAGRYRFVASAAPGGACSPERCDEIVVEVR